MNLCDNTKHINEHIYETNIKTYNVNNDLYIFNHIIASKMNLEYKQQQVVAAKIVRKPLFILKSDLAVVHGYHKSLSIIRNHQIQHK